MPTLPSRNVLRAEFDTAVLQLDQSRPGSKLTTEFYSRIGDSVFEAGYSALTDFCGAERKPQARLHVVSAPVGSGKTSFSLAFITAVARLAERSPDAPFGCVCVVDQITKAEALYQDLRCLLPMNAWSPYGPPIMTSGAGSPRRFSHPPGSRRISCRSTRSSWSPTPSLVARGATMPNRCRLQPRALTVVDERPEEVTVFDVEPSAAQRVREFVQEEEYAAAIGPHMDELVRFMIDRSMGGASLEQPTDHVAWIGVAERLAWFNTAEASDFVRANKGMPDMAPVLGFARSLANGYAFVARSHSGGRGTHFIGYETNLMVAPGMMLLDATADIDGVSQLCPWREVTEVPQARYDNLAIVHVPSVTRIRLHTFLRSAKNRRDYVNWMVETIKGHMEPGQRGLVVCKHALFENESVPAWPQGDERHKNRKLYTEDFGWEIEGRLLCATHWGSGIGANTWKVADVVVLFDEFYLRRHQIIATAQGLQQHKSTEGELARMKTLNSKAAVVDTLQEGHLLRWMKQMALRGRGRCYDEHGICGHQKLVYTGDLKRLLANKDRVFPGAQITTTPKTTDSRQTRADALLEILGRPGLPETITTKWISQQMGVPWRDVRQERASSAYR